MVAFMGAEYCAFLSGAILLVGESGVFDLLNPLIADLREPTLERLGFRAGDGLDQAEKAFGIGANHLLPPAGRGDGKGGGNLPHPLPNSGSRRRMSLR